MTIYGISGLGADERVFQYLQLSQRIEPIHWIMPQSRETIQNYARRFAAKIEDEEFILIAVSFGGLIAVELNKILKPKLTILISSATTRQELRVSYRLIGMSGFIRLLPAFLLNPPKMIMNWLFGARNTKLLKEILDDADTEFTKWAIIQLTTWNNKEKQGNILKIHGTKDKLIPFRADQKTIAIQNGEHFMVVDKASEVSSIIEENIRNLVKEF